MIDRIAENARLSVAPMMDWTDRHCRYFHRLMSQNALLYSEMVTAPAVIHGDRARLLNFDKAEHPVALQLGGSDPVQLAQAARIGVEFGYDEVNLNCGCPSDRVQSGSFGAVLMENPALVADCVAAMRAAVHVPITVKCRIGVDDNDSYAALCDFVAINRNAGCTTFIVHARKAWLSGLSPKQNREVPPLNYPAVFALKRDFPELEIILNGGLKTLTDCSTALDNIDGVMIGREAYQNPYMLARVDAEIFGRAQVPMLSRIDIALRYATYIEQQLQQGSRLNHMTRHILGLFNGVPGARQWRRFLSENAHKPGAGIKTYMAALERVGYESEAAAATQQKAVAVAHGADAAQGKVG